MKVFSPVRSARLTKILRISAVAVPVFILFIMLRGALAGAAAIVFGGAAVAFLTGPLVRIFEKRFHRRLAALCAMLSLLTVFAAALSLLLPSLITEAAELIRTLPQSLEAIKSWTKPVVHWLNSFLPGIQLLPASFPESRLSELAHGTVSFAGSIADFFYRFSLMIVLGYFFLCDRERILIRLELLIPGSVRGTAVRMGSAVCRELKSYLRGQGVIAAAVGVLSATGLALIGVRSSLILGAIIGLLNMIPYFGPVIGAIPAVLAAMSNGWKQAVLAAAVLWLVQQIDSMLISPRIMSSISGVSPAAVLLAVFIGSALGGIVGMLLAMPTVMSFRTVFRVFVQRYENV